MSTLRLLPGLLPLPAVQVWLAGLVWAVALAGTAEAAGGYGAVRGRFVLEGDVPEPAVLIEQGDRRIRNSEVCAAATLLRNDLVIDPETKGIQHIFVYLRRAAHIHPDLKEPPETELVVRQKQCRFEPHSLFLRVGQTVIVKSEDKVPHNMHPYPLRNDPVGFLVRPNDREGLPYTPNVAELLPIQVKCDIHPWMLSYWLILDHPYAAISAEDGSFKIEKLPAGKHEFRVWHERVGYVDAGEKRGFEIEIAEDGSGGELGTIRIPLATFDEN